MNLVTELALILERENLTENRVDVTEENALEIAVKRLKAEMETTAMVKARLHTFLATIITERRKVAELEKLLASKEA